MGIMDKAPRGGVLEEVGGKRRPLLLDLCEIERFEDEHRSIFEVYDGFFGRGAKPNSKEVRDLIAIGLVGAGLKDADAAEIVGSTKPKDLQDLYKVAQAMVGIAFYPDVEDKLDQDSDAGKQTAAPQ
jgi:hypothetical protein